MFTIISSLSASLVSFVGFGNSFVGEVGSSVAGFESAADGVFPWLSISIFLCLCFEKKLSQIKITNYPFFSLLILFENRQPFKNSNIEIY